MVLVSLALGGVMETPTVRTEVMRIEHFHSQIVAQFRQCLATRKTRVSSFH